MVAYTISSVIAVAVLLVLTVRFIYRQHKATEEKTAATANAHGDSSAEPTVRIRCGAYSKLHPSNRLHTRLR